MKPAFVISIRACLGNGVAVRAGFMAGECISLAHAYPHPQTDSRQNNLIPGKDMLL